MSETPGNLFDREWAEGIGGPAREEYVCPGQRGNAPCEGRIPRTSPAEIVARFGRGAAATAPPAFNWANRQDNERILAHFASHTVDELIVIIRWVGDTFQQRVDESWRPMDLDEMTRYVNEGLRGRLPEPERELAARSLVDGWWSFGIRLARNLKGPRL